MQTAEAAELAASMVTGDSEVKPAIRNAPSIMIAIKCVFLGPDLETGNWFKALKP